MARIEIKFNKTSLNFPI